MFSVSFLADVIIPNSHKMTEGRTNKPLRSAPFPHRERCLLDTLVDPGSTRLVASQTRRDASPTDLGRRPCRGHFRLNIIIALS